MAMKTITNSTKWGDEMDQMIKNDDRGVESEIIRIDRTKTALCRHFLSGDCSFGDKCNFVHDLDELRVKECRFGDECIKVGYSVSNGNYFNTATKVFCTFLHPEETKHNYCVRTGKISVKNIHSTASVTRPVKFVEDPMSFPSLPTVTSTPTTVKVAVPVVPVSKDTVEKKSSSKSEHDFIVEVDEKGHAVITCFSEDHIKVAFKIALESKRSVKIRRI